MPLNPSSEPDCPFCAIAAAYPPLSPSPVPSSELPSLLPPPVLSSSQEAPAEPIAHLLLSTPHVLAFLDHAPMSRGHVLVATRQHRERMSDASVQEGATIGKWLGLLSRAVVRAARGVVGVTGEEVGDWNIVQNNGARAAQVVPHVHFHIIPRVGDIPEIKARSWTVFGKGQREELDDEDAEVLTKVIRRRITLELEELGKREGKNVLKDLLGDERRGSRESKI